MRVEKTVTTSRAAAFSLVPPILGEPVHEDRLYTSPEKDDRPVAFRFPLPWSGDPLFNDPSAHSIIKPTR